MTQKRPHGNGIRFTRSERLTRKISIAVGLSEGEFAELCKIETARYGRVTHAEFFRDAMRDAGIRLRPRDPTTTKPREENS